MRDDAYKLSEAQVKTKKEQHIQFFLNWYYGIVLFWAVSLGIFAFVTASFYREILLVGIVTLSYFFAVCCWLNTPFQKMMLTAGVFAVLHFIMFPLFASLGGGTANMLLTSTLFILFLNWSVILVFFFCTFILFIIPVIVYALAAEIPLLLRFFISEHHFIFQHEDVALLSVIGTAHALAATFIAHFLQKKAENRYRLEIYLADKIESKENANFAREIAEGNLDVPFQCPSDDAVGLSLMALREKLQQQQQETLAKSWMAGATAAISEVLINSHQLETLGEKVVRKLSELFKMNQVCLYLVEWGEGTWVPKVLYEVGGTLPHEARISTVWSHSLTHEALAQKKVKHIRKVQTPWPAIASGSGQALPREILIIPLKNQSEVIGAIEMAGFREIQEWEISYISELSENIAAALFSLLSKLQTDQLLEESRLLNEQLQEKEVAMLRSHEEMKALLQESQVLTEQLRAQEEEMRLNMEQLMVIYENQQKQEQGLREQLAQRQEELKALKIHYDQLLAQVQGSINSSEESP
jgi:GAF domain-containing protein